MVDFNRADEEVQSSLLEPSDKDTGKWVPASQPEHSSKSTFWSTNGRFIRIALLFVVYLLASSTCFYFVQNQIAGEHTNPILDAVYFTFMTLTGYGNLVPDSNLTKLLACAFAILGMAVVVLLLSEAAHQIIEKQVFFFEERLSMLAKGGKAKMLEEIECNKARFSFYTATVVLALLMAVGTVFLWKVEGLNLVDSVYCACATVTTLGCRAKSFSSSRGRVFAVFWILVSTLCMAQFFINLAEWRAKNKQKKLIELVCTQRLTVIDLEEADSDCDGAVSASEFILHMLKKMGKITEDEKALLLQKFQDYDADKSGKLTSQDIPTD